MDPKQWTGKVREAFEAAHSIATDFRNIHIAPAHLAKAMLDDSNGLAQRIIEKGGGNLQAISLAVTNLVGRVPSQDPAPPDIGANRQLVEVLQRAGKFREERGDTHVALDHLLRAVARDRFCV